MKIKVLVKKSFIDRVSRERHVPGEKLLITEKRYKEIQKVGDFLEVIKETDEKTEETTKAADEKTEETTPAADKKEEVAPVQPRRRTKKNGN